MKTNAGFTARLLLYFSLAIAVSCGKDSTYPPTPAPPTPIPPGVNKIPALQLVVDSLISPVAMAEPPDSTHRLFIVEQTGKIWIIGSDGRKITTPFIDIAGKMAGISASYDERGLLGLAFPANYKSTGKFYLFYTAPPRPGTTVPGGASWNNLTRVSEFKVSSSDPNVADLASERILLEDDHPYLNHNGGDLHFGPDGFLYIAIGDGGNSDDVGNGHVPDWYTVNAGGNVQDNYANLQGNILRIDVNGSPYSIPPDNPFVGTAARPEIYAFGFRNPYRFSFDMAGTHQLLVGDVGQSLYEEIDLVTKGGNYGWNVKEGTHCFNTDNDLVERTSCPVADSAGNPLLDPVIELVNSANPKGGGIGIAVIGGYVYRGSALPALQGKYIFGMLTTNGQASGKIFSTDHPLGSGMWSYSAFTLDGFTDNLGQYLKSFGQDQDGEIYLITSANIGPSGNTGKVYKLVAK